MFYFETLKKRCYDDMFLIRVYIISTQLACILANFQYFSNTDENSIPTIYQYINKTLTNSSISYGKQRYDKESECIHSCQKNSHCKSINMWKDGDSYLCEILGTTVGVFNDSLGWYFTKTQVRLFRFFCFLSETKILNSFAKYNSEQLFF